MPCYYGSSCQVWVNIFKGSKVTCFSHIQWWLIGSHLWLCEYYCINWIIWLSRWYCFGSSPHRFKLIISGGSKHTSHFSKLWLTLAFRDSPIYHDRTLDSNHELQRCRERIHWYQCFVCCRCERQRAWAAEGHHNSCWTSGGGERFRATTGEQSSSYSSSFNLNSLPDENTNSSVNWNMKVVHFIDPQPILKHYTDLIF